MEHYCEHEREWGEVTTLLSKISKDVYGNGDEGLVKTVPRLEGKINSLVTAVASHTTVVSQLLEYQARTNGESRQKKEDDSAKLIADELVRQRIRDHWQRVMWVIMASVGIAGIILSVYLGIKSNKNSNTAVENTTITNDKLDMMDNSGLTRAFQEIKKEKGILKLDSIK